MSQSKRHLSDNDSSEDKTKKLRRIFDKTKTINCLENLPVEIFHEVFDYLEGCQLYEAFSKLNIRFQNLLTCSSLRLKIDLHSHSETLLQYRSTQIVIPNRYRIISLNLISFWNFNGTFPPFTIDSVFSHLESLVLDNIKSNALIPLLVSLMSLPRLFTLCIYSYSALEDISNVYQIILNLPMLRYNRLSFFSLETLISLPIATNQQFSGIKYLVIDHCCALDELIVLLSYTPQLCRLTCEQVNEPNGNTAKEAFNTISSLVRISITRCYAGFDELEMFLKKTSPQLQVLRVTSSRDITYLDADRWERIISQHLVHLHVFEFKYEESIDEDLEVTLYHESINRFNSSFWMKRKWFFKLYIDTDFWMENIIIYSVFPFSKIQTNSGEYTKSKVSFINDVNQNITEHGIMSNEDESVVSPLILSESNQLTVLDFYYIDNDDYYNDIINPILSVIPITCLNITRKEIFIGTLINLINCLPNLDTLVVSSLVMENPRCLSIDETRTLRVISNNSKITKVKLHRMSDLAQVQFLFDLCSRMEYLEVNCINSICVEGFIRFILMKNIKYIPKLSSLCLEFSQTKENIIEQLKKMIDLEQLSHDYTIKPLNNKLYIRWNSK